MSKIMAYLEKHEESFYVTAEMVAHSPKHVEAVVSHLARRLDDKGVDRVFFVEPEFDPVRFQYLYRAFGFEIIYEGVE
jgi:hypothetical protein